MLSKLVGWALPTVAPKARHSIAQGETLGWEQMNDVVALKGRHSDGPSHLLAMPAPAVHVNSAPLGLAIPLPPSPQGSAALHPGLSNTTFSRSEPRRGVILLVVMVLLVLLTMLGLTLVLVTAQGRLSALAAARAGLQDEHDEKELANAITQVIAGSTDPNSSIGAHSLLEDLYGLPHFFGQISGAFATPAVIAVGGGQGASPASPVTSGALLQFTIVPAKATGAAGAGPSAQLPFILPVNSGAFCGQVLTMLTGPAAGQSGRVVGYFYDSTVGGNYASIQVSSLGGLVPNVGDEFMINGRAYSGTGFGLDLTKFQGGAPWQVPNLTLTPTGVPLLTAVESTLSAAYPASNLPASNMPYAFLPNHAQIAVSNYAPQTPAGAYWDIAGPGGANETYDAPDFQNMMLAMHTWSVGTSSVVTPIPSLHRPELVGWYYNQAIVNANPAISMANPAMRRKVILRPEPTDHVFTDSNGNGVWDAREPWYDANGNGVVDPGEYLDLNGDGVWTFGETDFAGNTFNPVTGCWYITATGAWALDPTGTAGLDFDNDGDGVPDSIWVDIGLQVQTGSDGKFYKNLAAILCIDLDGKVNLNASGSLAQLDPLRYAGNLSGPFAGSAPTGTVALYNTDLWQRLVPVGQGYGPADINPVHIFQRAQGGVAANAQTYYATFLLGYGNPSAASPTPAFVDGRYGESTRLTIPPGNPPGATPYTYPGVYPPGSYYFSPTSLTVTQMLLNGPRPGWSQWFDPYATAQLAAAGVTAYWVNDPVALARFSDIRPGLLSPPSANATPFFFDFLDALAAAHIPTAHGSPSDLHSRGFLTTDVSGHPYYAGTTNIPWQVTGIAEPWQAPGTPTWSGVMNDVAPAQYSATLPFMANEVVLDEAVDTQYELDLTQNADRGGRNTGNNVYGSDFTTIDNALIPSEGEGILRTHDTDSSSYLTRLNNLETVSTGNSTTSLAKDSIRLAVTTESWDLPVPNIALTPRQLIDITAYTNQFGPFTGTANLNLNNISLADLARARMYVENFGNANFPNISLPSGPDLSLFGNLRSVQQNVATFPVVPVWPLLSPDLILGMRLDVNRLLGNGFDDNGNGVVDEPAEAFWLDAGGNAHGESLFYPYSQQSAAAWPKGQINAATGMNNVRSLLDLNNDGFYPVNPITFTAALTDPQTGVLLPADLTDSDMRARQLLARQLYCLMMLLLDDRVINPNPTAMAQIFNSNGAPMPANWPQYSSLGAREQAAYVIAQWAINVVDFRDRDSIMTPFEFDLYPFHADSYVNAALPAITAAELNQTWNVDDIIDPAYGTPLAYSHQDDSQSYRGLVWGCERPELLLTETAAFHDRGTADTSKGENINDATQTPSTGPDTLYSTPPAGTVPFDRDYDQVRRPRGSLIVELMNPTNYWDAPQRDMQSSGVSYANGLPQPWQQPDGNGNQGYGVNLAQVAVGQPVNGSGPLASPVWRLAIAYSPTYNESAYYTGATASPYTTTNNKQLDPRAPVLPFVPGGAATASTVIHRAVYFAPYEPSFVTGGAVVLNNTSRVNEVLLNQSFFADPDVFLNYSGATGLAPATLLLPPGQYALVGPANQDPVNNNGNYMIYAGKNQTAAATPTNTYPMSFQLGNQVANTTIAYVYGNGGVGWGPYAGGYGPTAATSTTIKPVIGVPIQTSWFASSGGNAQYVPHNMLGPLNGTPTIATTLRMSVSEPEHGYPLWPAAVGSTQDDTFYYSQVGTPNTAAIPTLQYFPQHPFDSGLPDPQTGNSYSPFNDVPNYYVAPDGTNPQNQTPGYTVIFLQRLANPLQAWDANLNPYITVDSMPVDLTSYTGEPNAASSTATVEPAYPNGVPGAFKSFESRRRGYNTNGSQTIVTAQGVPNIWTPLPLLQPSYNPYTAASQYGVGNNDGSIITPLPLHTFGYINTEYSGGTYWTAGGAPVGASGMPAYVYNGDPLLPIPWLAWYNRPYVSQYELMLVPASSPSSLASDFGMLGWKSNGANELNEYVGGQPSANSLPVAQFAHLLNFFDSQAVPIGTTDTASSTYLGDLFRAFEFLQVSSRFAGTQEMLNPTLFSGNNALAANQAYSVSVSHLFHPPFNWLSRYREPGRINLNTIFDPVIFQSLMDDFPGTLYPANDVAGQNAQTSPNMNSLWYQFLQSRQNFGTPNAIYPPNPIAQFYYNNVTKTPSLYANWPTYFGNPFRPDGSNAFVPQTTATNPAQSNLMYNWNYPGTGQQNLGVNATMLRPSQTNTNLALFDDTSFDTYNYSAAYKSGANLTPYRNATQNATFQYQMFTRLGNTVTNRSNVYAIWVTLGKFEVQPVAVSNTNPDGYKLVAPAPDTTGQQETTRGFYIYDRSIPVGFQRGQDTNIERGFLLERVLQ
jgi:hypothetical protein